MTTQRKSNAKAKTTAPAGPVVDEPPPPPPTECELKGGRCSWVIAAPSGPEAPGKCKICGTERTFRNSFEYSSWYGSKNAPGRKPGRRPGRPKKEVV